MAEACPATWATWNTTSVKIRQKSCLAAYQTQAADAGLGTTKIAFGLGFTLPGVNFATLNSNAAAKQAVYDTIFEVLTGVTEVSNLVATDARRRNLMGSLDISALGTGHRSLAGNAAVSVDVNAITTAPVSSASTAAADFSADLSTSMDSGVFAVSMNNNVEANGAAAVIPASSVLAVSSTTVSSSGGTFVSTSSPTQQPTEQPGATSSSDNTESDVGVAFAVIGGVFGAIGIGYALYSMRASRAGSSAKVFIEGTGDALAAQRDPAARPRNYQVDVSAGSGDAGFGVPI